MVHFPVKKIIQTARMCILVFLVMVILSTIDRWFRILPDYRLSIKQARSRYWEGAALKDDSQQLTPDAERFEQEVVNDERLIVKGLGEGGAPVTLSIPERNLADQSLKKLALNVYISDMIAYNRSLEDYRNPLCKDVLYDAELPSASVIIIFHNEPYSVLLRTIWSVVNSVRRDRPWFKQASYLDRDSLGYPGQDRRSPLLYLKEIILVDDNSTLPELQGKLSYYVRTRLPPDLIRILRLPERGGLTRARLAGAHAAIGTVLVFLDAHCEVQPDWLRPLLQRMKHAPHAVVMPIIDTINKATLSYNNKHNFGFQVGGFSFEGFFTWIDVPEREKKRRGSDIGPTRSPTMAGGLFAIDRNYYFQLGAYDEEMRGWGGGTLEVIPCSRVGHIFRSFHPYGLPYSTDTHGINTARMAEVWMDNYKELFYLHRPDLRKSKKIGDVSSRKLLRKKLKCKSFEWYLQHVYKEKFVPVRNAFGYGRFRSDAYGMCLDNLNVLSSKAPLAVFHCQRSNRTKLSGTQFFTFTRSGQVRDETRCAVPDLPNTKRQNSSVMAAGETDIERDIEVRVMLQPCDKYEDAQTKWVYMGNKQLVHWKSGLCLCAGIVNKATVTARRCENHATQRWHFDYSELNHFQLSPNEEPSEIEKILLELRASWNNLYSL